MKENECPRVGKFLGCQFEARFDKSEPKLGECSLNYVGSNGEARLEQFRQLTYVRDVCVRCGRTIERNSK